MGLFCEVFSSSSSPARVVGHVMMGLAALFAHNLNLIYAQNSPQDYLDAHNAARAKVGTDPISWDDTVAAYAQNYTRQRQADCDLVHSGGPYGENLAWSTGSSFTGVEAVNLWVEEKPNYDYNTNSCLLGNECKHYTQVVWSRSLRLGCARVQCLSNRGTFIACNYDPPGNYALQRPYGAFDSSPAPPPDAGLNSGSNDWCLVSID